MKAQVKQSVPKPLETLPAANWTAENQSGVCCGSVAISEKRKSSLPAAPAGEPGGSRVDLAASAQRAGKPAPVLPMSEELSLEANSLRL